MKLKAFAVRDAKANVYNTPFFKQTQPEAERDFHRLVHDPKSLISMYPDDFDLFYVGDYDDNLGIFSALDTPQHIQKAAHVRQPTA